MEQKYPLVLLTAVSALLEQIDPHPDREGLKETPKRVLNAFAEWFDGYGQDPQDHIKTFADGAEGYDEMIVLDGIPVYSHCEHHIAAIFGTCYIGYIPDKKILGLSKFARIVDIFAHRLQVQERLTKQIADAIEEGLNPRGVAVVIKARHFCIESRGVKKPGINTTTRAMRGAFMDDLKARNEFMMGLQG